MGRLSLISLLVSGATLTSAACECGYTSTLGADAAGERILFTDLIETDFIHEANVTTNTDWRPQAFNITNTKARGEFGEMFAVNNVVTNPITNTAKYSGPGVMGGDAGLTLTVRSEIENDMVGVGEVATDRNDMFYGTFRAGIKLTDVPGTCAAFFWYFNDTQEIDMEFLSREFNYDNNSFPVNLVLQSHEAAESGHDASETPNFQRVNLPFNPTTAFHEYRIDFVQDEVHFLADGQVLASMNGSAVPTSAGQLMLTHWSNGNEKWSGGPPQRDAVMTVSYVKAYFNSTAPQRMRDWEGRCQDVNAEMATCEIPDVTAGNDEAATFFFSQQDNMTVNQTVSGLDSAAGRGMGLSVAAMGSVLLVSGWILGMW